MIHNINILRMRPFDEAAARALRALPHAHRAEEDAVIGVAQLIANIGRGRQDVRDNGLIRKGRRLFESDFALEPFRPGSPEHAANLEFGQDPYWGTNVGLRDWRPGTSVATVVCGLRDALVLRNDTPDWKETVPPQERIKDLTEVCEVYIAEDLSNHALIETMAGVEAFLRADLSCTCDVPLADISLRFSPEQDQ